MKRTFCTLLEGPANCMAINREANQVAVAGRNGTSRSRSKDTLSSPHVVTHSPSSPPPPPSPPLVSLPRTVFKIYEIDDENHTFVEATNMRVGKHQNLNYSCNDVAWNPGEDNVLATGATNGSVVIWNLQKSSRSKLDVVFSDHKRTVNKVCFHPTESYLLLSGSQDGTMRLFDLRKKEASSTFHSLSESVRDVQFCPHQYFQFASVQENGNVQTWDYRRCDRYERQFMAHNGPVFSCDWHPEEKRWLATAGRDKSIKVWDLQQKQPSLEHSIQTIAPVAKINWRPLRKFYIASSSLVVDFSVYVWDIRRPFVPYLAFMEHKDVTTGFVWRNDPRTLISAGKDNTLYQHVFDDAHRPANHANPMGLDINSHGDIGFAASDAILKSGQSSSAANSFNNSVATPSVNVPNSIGGSQIINFFSSNASTSSAINQFSGRFVQIFNKKQPTASDQFKDCSSSLLLLKNQNADKSLSMDWFVIFALRYQLTGKSFSELCEHNADVAYHLNRPQVAQTWKIIQQLYSAERAPRSSTFTQVPPGAAPDGDKVDANDIGGSRHASGGGRVHHMSGNKNAATQTAINLAPSSLQVPSTVHFSAANDQVSDDSDSSQESDLNEPFGDKTFYSNIKGYLTGQRSYQLNQADFLPSFFFGDEDSSSSLFAATMSMTSNNSADAFYSLDGQQEEWEFPREAFQLRHPITDCPIPPEIADPGMESPTSLEEEEEVPVEDSGYSTVGLTSDFDALSLSVLSSVMPPYPAWEFNDLVVDTLRHYAAQGDVQTAVSAVIVLGDRLKLSIEETTLEFWFHSYIDILSRFQLWNVANQVISLSPLIDVNGMNQMSTSIQVTCGLCRKPNHGKVAWICNTKCKSSTETSRCAVCHGVVIGLYAWCQGCSHGGHLQHIQEWLQTCRYCPAGCGHQCEYT